MALPHQDPGRWGAQHVRHRLGFLYGDKLDKLGCVKRDVLSPEVKGEPLGFSCVWLCLAPWQPGVVTGEVCRWGWQAAHTPKTVTFSAHSTLAHSVKPLRSTRGWLLFSP